MDGGGSSTCNMKKVGAGAEDTVLKTRTQNGEKDLIIFNGKVVKKR